MEASEGGAIGTGNDLARGRASQTLVSGENAVGVSQINNIAGFDAAWELDVFGNSGAPSKPRNMTWKPPSPRATWC